ncbi:MAG: c-type cytochrome, partial [Opitutaceae bacterium]|nr:c-type cytochrome [Verrucomicrobiales bacterium]
DARQPLLLWWAIEDKCGTDKEAVLSLFYDRQLWTAPIVDQHILSRLMRRFAATGKRDDLLICARLFSMSPGAAQTSRLTQGFEEAYQGRPMVALPEELLNAMEKAGGESLLIATRRAKPEAVRKALTVIADNKSKSSQRLQLIQVFSEIREPASIPVLLGVSGGDSPPDLRRAAFGALQTYDDPSIATSIITELRRLPDAVRPSALSLVTSRPAWTLQLVKSIDDGSVDKKLVSSEDVRRMKKLPRSPASDEIDRLTAKLWPNIRQASSAELEKEIHRLEGLINATTGSPYTGKQLFDQACVACHKLFAKGGEIGPDLSTYPRTDLANLLLNIVNPNAEIREGYESFTVTTKDGRTLIGFLADQDPHVVLLRTVDGQTASLPRTEIARMEPSGGSLMPEGLLTGLGDQQIRDLFAYLRSTQPLNDAK